MGKRKMSFRAWTFVDAVWHCHVACLLNMLLSQSFMPKPESWNYNGTDKCKKGNHFFFFCVYVLRGSCNLKDHIIVTVYH